MENRKTILVVDDDLNMRRVLEYRLRREGYSILLAGDGLDALDQACRHHPDLIILDLALPKMDGLSVLDHLRHNAETSAIAVMILTAYGHDEARDRSLELGVSDFVVKPFSPRQLVAGVRRIFCAREEPHAANCA